MTRKRAPPRHAVASPGATGGSTLDAPPADPPPAGKPRKLSIGKLSFLGVEIGPIELPLPARWGLGRSLAALAVLALLGLGTGLLLVRGPLSEARTALRMVRYDLARDALARLPAWMAWWPEVARSERKIRLGLDFYAKSLDHEALGAELRRQRAAAPADPDLMVLEANYRLAQGQPDFAQVRVLADSARQLDPQLAEAWFLLGMEDDLGGNSSEAIAHYRKAVEQAPESPQYRGNLARALLDSGARDEAIAQYSQIDAYPLARLEQALGEWSAGEWGRARQAQRDALQMLDDARLMDNYFNRRAWLFALAETGVRLSASADKRCYALLGEAASSLLGGETQTVFPPAACKDPAPEIAQLVAHDLCRYVAAAHAGQVAVVAQLRQALRLAPACPELAAETGTSPTSATGGST
ncbi:tetratricopeptide repeat protein [Niveibacterium sp. SC-1]|uniref:tetratricopeptide repeat protein n=1 Tax=Niveibacterium sp. SC-1 TaxID=3135646 RepID=UPI00311D903D